MDRGIVEGRVVLHGDAIQRSFLAGPLRHPDGPRLLACWLISHQSLPSFYAPLFRLVQVSAPTDEAAWRRRRVPTVAQRRNPQIGSLWASRRSRCGHFAAMWPRSHLIPLLHCKATSAGQTLVASHWAPLGGSGMRAGVDRPALCFVMRPQEQT